MGGLVGAYLIAFKDPAAINPLEWQPAILSVGAALLWGLGTVLGRRLSSLVPFGELTALRLTVGLIAAFAIAGSRDEITPLLSLDLPSMSSLVALALVPGLFSLLVYYRGLRGTPASAATLGELSFPLTALLVGYVALHESLSVSQWVGVLVLAATVTALGTVKPQGTPTAVTVMPVHAGDAAS
jgi:drug/metabolite transporter (DMT)-like permease